MSSPTSATTPLPKEEIVIATIDDSDSSFLDWTDTEDMSEPLYSPRPLGYGLGGRHQQQHQNMLRARGQPGSRKYRRWLNLAALELAEATLSDNFDYRDRNERQGRQNRFADYDIESGEDDDASTSSSRGSRKGKKARQIFYEPKPTTFQRLFESQQDYLAWQSFIEVTEELQDQLLYTHKEDVRSIVRTPHEVPTQSAKKIDDHLSQCFSGVPKRNTSLINNIEFILEMEKELTEFIALTNTFRENPALQDAFNDPALNPNAKSSSKSSKKSNADALAEDISREERREVVYEQLKRMTKASTASNRLYSSQGYSNSSSNSTNADNVIIPQIRPLEFCQSHTQIGSSPTIRFTFPTTFLRLLGLGLCRFYRLDPKNQTLKGGLSGNGEDIHLVIVSNTFKIVSPPPISLSAFLKAQHKN